MTRQLLTRCLGLCVIFGAICAGCIIIPTDYHALDSRTNVREETTTTIIPGQTTKVDIFLALGEPDEVSPDGSRLVYRWTKVKVIVAVAGPGGGDQTEDREINDPIRRRHVRRMAGINDPQRNPEAHDHRHQQIDRKKGPAGRRELFRRRRFELGFSCAQRSTGSGWFVSGVEFRSFSFRPRGRDPRNKPAISSSAKAPICDGFSN